MPVKQSDGTPSHKVNTSCDRYVEIIVPAYNEEEVLPEFHKRISTVLDSMPVEFEIIYINDGSTENPFLFFSSSY